MKKVFLFSILMVVLFAKVSSAEIILEFSEELNIQPDDNTINYNNLLSSVYNNQIITGLTYKSETDSPTSLHIGYQYLTPEDITHPGTEHLVDNDESSHNIIANVKIDF